MSVPAVGSVGPLGPGALPVELRGASPERRREYAAALDFERQLVAQLTKGLTRSLERGAGPRGDLVSGALADALVQGGGLGLARDLDRALHARPAQEPPR
jgi:hypothetical protein